jgi:hypothetical protein
MQGGLLMLWVAAPNNCFSRSILHFEYALILLLGTHARL